MSTVVIGGGPRPQARIVQIYELGDGATANALPTFEIRDGREILAELKSLPHAMALIKILQEGE